MHRKSAVSAVLPLSFSPVSATRRFVVAGTLLLAAGMAFTAGMQQVRAAEPVRLLNVSYDVSREFYKDYNAAFVAHYKAQSGKELQVEQSHAGSSAQARAVADGLAADVVTMNTTSDIDFLAGKGLVAKDWQTRFPAHAAPTFSTMLFLVRPGNPKKIADWKDLVRDDVKVVVVNPKTGGNGRMAYLAAWGSVRNAGGTDAQAADFVQKLYRNVPVLARGGRDATGIFLQRGQGDVLITFESEVLSVDRDFGKGKVEVVYPSASLKTDNPVAVVEPNVKRKGTAEAATAYLTWLYSKPAQEIAVRHALRPSDPEVLKAHAAAFKPIQMFAVEDYFGSLEQAQKVHFNDGGEFDRLYNAPK